MADDLELHTSPQLVVDSGNAAAIAGQKLREVLLVATVTATLLGLAKTRDVVGIMQWVQGDGLEPFLTAAFAIAVSAYNTFRLVVNHQRLVLVTRFVHDRVAVLITTRERWDMLVADVKAWFNRQWTKVRGWFA